MEDMEFKTKFWNAYWDGVEDMMQSKTFSGKYDHDDILQAAYRYGQYDCKAGLENTKPKN